MISAKLNEPANHLNTTNFILRLMLCHNELFRLPRAGRGLAVVAGTAWVTVNGQDIFLAPDQSLCLPARRDTALISALGRTPLILEVFGATSAPHNANLATSPQGKNYGA